MAICQDIVIYNQYKKIGDAVLLEPIAREMSSIYPGDVYILTPYSEIYNNNPSIKCFNTKDAPENYRIIDLTNAIKSIDIINGEAIIHSDKIDRMYKEAGLQVRRKYHKPKIYLSDDELKEVDDIRTMYQGKRIGVIPRTSAPIKNWAYMSDCISQLSNINSHIFVFSDEQLDLSVDGHVIHITDIDVRDLIVYLSTMDVVVGVDTGPCHIAGALGVPLKVIGYNQWKCLYEIYPNAEYFASKYFCHNMKAISPNKVYRKTKREIKPPVITKKRKQTAVVLLEGLGGTVTLADHAKKIAAIDGRPVHLVVRKHSQLFDGNPDVDGVTCVGSVFYKECVPDIIKRFDRVAIIKTGIGKWSNKRISGLYDGMFRRLYKSHPVGMRELERTGLNMIQTANMSLGLSYDTIDVNVYCDKKPNIELPERYIAVSNGVDTWHKGLKQTKCWEHEYWEELVDRLDMPVVQLGTEFDKPIDGTMNLLSQTSIQEMLYILRNAYGIICTEGGLMHLGYAVKNKNVFVMAGPTRGNIYSYKSLHKINSPICSACYWDNGEWYKDCREYCDAGCMKAITPARVANKVEEVLYEAVA